MKRHFAFWAFLLLASFSVNAKIYKKSAIASYYAEAFHGKKTSNGEIFNMYSLTCAHKMLPFDTVLKVTNLANGKSVNVRVNDRGPFVHSREIDLSKVAAVKLDMIKSGTTNVRLEIVKLGAYTKLSRQTGKKACEKAGIKYYEVSVGKPQNLESQKKTGNLSNETSCDTETLQKIQRIKSIYREPNKFWDIQIGAFSVKENALSYARKAMRAGVSSVILQISGKTFRVTVKNVITEDLNKKIDELVQKGYVDLIVRERKQ